MYDDGWMVYSKALEEIGHELTEMLSQQLLGGAEENYEKPRPRFQPSNSRIEVWSVTARPTRSVTLFSIVTTVPVWTKVHLMLFSFLVATASKKKKQKKTVTVK
jgi:hypothetical protein